MRISTKQSKGSRKLNGERRARVDEFEQYTYLVPSSSSSNSHASYPRGLPLVLEG